MLPCIFPPRSLLLLLAAACTPHPSHPLSQLCREVVAGLKAVFNHPGGVQQQQQAPLVLDPHILSAGVLEAQEGQGARMRERGDVWEHGAVRWCCCDAFDVTFFCRQRRLPVVAMTLY